MLKKKKILSIFCACCGEFFYHHLNHVRLRTYQQPLTLQQLGQPNWEISFDFGPARREK